MNSNPLGNSSLPQRKPFLHQRFWKMAGVLTTVQLVFGVLIVYSSMKLEYDNRFEHMEDVIRDRVGQVAAEIERRAFPAGVTASASTSLLDLSERLIIDLSTRLSDPIVLLNPDGKTLRTIVPDPATFGVVKSVNLVQASPARMKEMLQLDRVIVQVNRADSDEDSWALAPIYDAVGDLAGGLLVKPLQSTVQQQMRQVQRAFIPVILLVITFSLVSGVSLSYYFNRN